MTKICCISCGNYEKFNHPEIFYFFEKNIGSFWIAKLAVLGLIKNI